MATIGIFMCGEIDRNGGDQGDVYEVRKVRWRLRLILDAKGHTRHGQSVVVIGTDW